MKKPLANVYSLENARRRRRKQLSEEQRQIARELAELVGVPEPTTEELRRMEKELPSNVVADDPPYGNHTPPKLLAQYYFWQTLDELRYKTSPRRLNRMRDFLNRYQRFAGPALRETLQYCL